MDAADSGGIWTSAIALLSTGGAGAALWKVIYGMKARLTIVESTTVEHVEKLKRGSKKIGDIHTSVEVLAEKTQGLGDRIDEFGQGQKTILDHILRAKTGPGG